MNTSPEYWLDNWNVQMSLQKNNPSFFSSHLKTLDWAMKEAPDWHPIFNDLLNTNQKDLQELLAKNPKTPKAVLEKLVSTRVDLAMLVAQNQHTPTEVLFNMANSDDMFLLIAIVKNPNASYETMSKISVKKIPPVIKTIIDWQKWTQTTLENAQDHEDNSVRGVVARNTNKLDILEKMSQDKSEFVRAKAAGNPNATSELLHQMCSAAEVHKDTMFSAIKNPKVAPETLELLAKTDNPYVRAEVAKNQKTLPETLAGLAKDKETQVVLAVAANSKTPPETLAELANNKEHEVVLAVAANRTTSSEALDKIFHCADDLRYRLNKLYDDPKNNVGIFRNEKSEELATIAALDADCWTSELSYLVNRLIRNKGDIIRAVAENPSIYTGTARQIATHQVPQIRHMVASNPNVPVRILEDLVREEFDYYKRPISVAWSPKGDRMKIAVAKNPATPTNLLKAIINDPDSTEYAKALARTHPNAAPEDREVHKMVVEANKRYAREIEECAKRDKERYDDWVSRGSPKYTPPSQRFLK